jgi:hypothetical protein
VYPLGCFSPFFFLAAFTRPKAAVKADLVSSQAGRSQSSPMDLRKGASGSFLLLSDESEPIF